MAYNRTLQHFTSPQELATLWATGRSYLLNQVVFQDNKLYRCLVNHTSGTFQTDYANSNWVQISNGLVPWLPSIYYTADQFVEENDKIYRCSVSHTSNASFSVDLGAGKWVEVSAGSGSGVKNYVVNGNFESNSDTGWSLARSTLDATTKLPNQISSSWTSAAGTLAKSVISSGQLAGSYSLQLSSTASTTAGDMLVTDALALDLEAQASVQTFSFFYKVTANQVVTNITTTSGSPTITVASASGLLQGMVLNSANAGGTITNIVGTTVTLSANATATGTVSGTFVNTLPGTSSNPIGVAIYDATNSQWIQPAGVFNVIQSSGVGKASGTFQVPSNTTSVRLAVYFPNQAGATASYPFTVVLDDFVLGPQVVQYGAPVTDWVSYTPTVTGLGTGSGTAIGYYRRAGDSIEAKINFTKDGSNGTNAGAAVTFTLPSGLFIDTSKIPLQSQRVALGVGSKTAANFSAFDAVALINTYGNTILLSGPFPNIDAVGSDFNASSQWTFDVIVPISGWSSSVQMSNDTDTRVVAARGDGQPATAAAGAPIIFPSSTLDTHSSYSTSTGRYTVPVSGKYRLSFVHNSTNTYLVSPYINGTNTGIIMGIVVSGSGGGSVLLDLQAGQIVDHRPSGSTGAFGSSGGNFSIERLSGPATIAASETVAMAARKISGNHTLNGSDQTVAAWDLVITDSHGAFNATTGIYTVPVSGRYLITGQVNFNSGSGTQWAYIGGLGTGGGVNQTGARVALPFSIIYRYNAGETISVAAFQNASASFAYSTDARFCTQLNISRLGN